MIDFYPQWRALCKKYSSNEHLIRSCWEEIQKAYQGKGRYYHNLSHLENLLRQADSFHQHLKAKDVIRFSIFYHDLVYSSLRKDNERKSAEKAQARLGQLGFPIEKTERSYQQILATQQHQIPDSSTDPDLPFFLDFDLSVLGNDWVSYQVYSSQIRKEYRIYPGWMYRKGRRKVLTHFLERKRLFFTDVYYRKYEKRARENLQRELGLLGK